MKNTGAFILAYWCFAFSFQDDPFKQLHELAGGTWVMKTNKGFVCEQWQTINNKKLHERGYKIVGRDTTLEEEVQLISNDSGIFYISTVSGQNEGKPVPFRLTEVKGNQFIFSNPDHDYPQIIGYHFISKDSLHAWIDGKNRGKDLKIEYSYKRIK